MNLSEAKLYVIVSSGLSAVPLEEAVDQVLEGGADMIQLREKGLNDRSFLDLALKIRTLCQRRNRIFIVNDNVGVALACKAEGIHLGQDDLPLKAARELVGPGGIIGVSTHKLSQALDGESGGADYLGFGPIFFTRSKNVPSPLGTKPLGILSERIRIPIFPIGGITPQNLGEVVKAGISRAAVCSAVLSAKDILKATKTLKEILCG